MDSSNYQIAKLLMDVKRIAGDEMRMKACDVIVSHSADNIHRLTPPQLSTTFETVPQHRSRPSMLAPKRNAPTSPPATKQIIPHLNPRSRLISMDYGDTPACVTPTSPRIMTTIGICEPALDHSCLLRSEDLQPILIKPPSSPKDMQKKKRAVGRTLREGVQWKGTLRKKFSWKSFPELETYLVENRAQYLEYSNSLNYTKAQKNYNNKLTQGLLDLAAGVGYTFEGFSFAAVRDRIRCFYKSYVQATKKKKRSKKS